MADKQLTTEQLLAMLTAGPPRIAELTAACSPEQLRAHPIPGEWSAVDILAHLRSCADVWGNCIRQIVAEDHPTIRAINPTTWIKQTNYHDLEFAPSFAAFAQQRSDIVSFLQALAPESWTRAATVTGAGNALERTVFFYAQWLATHERPHLKQIASIVKALNS